MNPQARKYGPNWQLVQEYLHEIPNGFLFTCLGGPNPADAAVRRIHDWDACRRIVDYSFEGATAHTCPYLSFLRVCHAVRERNESLGTKHTLFDQLVNATNEAGNLYADKVGGNEDLAFLEFIDSEKRERFWGASVQDHCCYIAIEMVVAHLTDSHLMREMWYWYRAGHWPCGWEGDWPEGRLIVF